MRTYWKRSILPNFTHKRNGRLILAQSHILKQLSPARDRDPFSEIQAYSFQPCGEQEETPYSVCDNPLQYWEATSAADVFLKEVSYLWLCIFQNIQEKWSCVWRYDSI